MIIAAYQGPSPEGDMVQAFRKINETLAQAAKQGAKMVVFPELYLLGYNQMHLHEELAQPIGGDWEMQCATLAQKHQCGLTIGWAERDKKKFTTVPALLIVVESNLAIIAKSNSGGQ